MCVCESVCMCVCVFVCLVSSRVKEEAVAGNSLFGIGHKLPLTGKLKSIRTEKEGRKGIKRERERVRQKEREGRQSSRQGDNAECNINISKLT